MITLLEELRELRRTLGMAVDLPPSAIRVLVGERDPWVAYQRAVRMLVTPPPGLTSDPGPGSQTNTEPGDEPGNGGGSATEAARHHVIRRSGSPYLIPVIGLGFAGLCTVEAVQLAMPMAPGAAVLLSLLAALALRSNKTSPGPSIPASPPGADTD